MFSVQCHAVAGSQGFAAFAEIRNLSFAQINLYAAEHIYNARHFAEIDSDIIGNIEIEVFIERFHGELCAAICIGVRELLVYILIRNINQGGAGNGTQLDFVVYAVNG